MKIVRGRADARWLPARFNFALFRLFAYMRMRTAKPEAKDVSLIIDRNQNGLESPIIGVWCTLTLTGFAVGTLFENWPLPLAILPGVVLAITALEVPVFVVGLAFRKRQNNIPLTSFLLMSGLIGIAVFFARAQSVQTWVRVVAWQFLAGVGLNALAAPFAFLLRGSFAKMEKAFGGFTSEL